MDDVLNQTLETVMVQAPAGPMRVNKRDYDADPDKWPLIDENGNRQSTATLVMDDDAELTDLERQKATDLGVLIGGNWKPSTARRKIAEAENARNGAPVEADVSERNGRYYVVNKANGDVIKEQDGYATAVEAWTAATTA